MKTRSVAIVGGGLSGLTAAWLLSKDPSISVVLYESLASPGFAHASFPLTDTVDVDVPQRYFVDEYYPTLSRLYQHLGIDSVPVSSPTSFLDMAAPDSAYFAYHNLCLFGGALSLPWIHPRRLLSPRTWALLYAFWQFKRCAARDFRAGAIPPTATLRAYLDRLRISPLFRDKLLGPLFAVVCTCSVAAALDYPALLVVEWFLSTAPRTHRFSASHHRVRGGVRRIVPLLLARVDEVHCATRVAGIEPSSPENGGGVLLEQTKDGVTQTRRFDAVVLASPPNATLRLLRSPSPLQQRIFGSFGHASSRVVLHRDPVVLPRDRRQWNSMNFTLSADGGECQATLWQNSVQELPPQFGDVFQTWNPLVAIQPELIISESWFDRPVITPDSMQRLAQLREIQGAGGIWYSGSYAHQGIPLLESAASSGLEVASQITSIPVPFEIPSRFDTLVAPKHSYPFLSCVAVVLAAIAYLIYIVVQWVISFLI